MSLNWGRKDWEILAMRWATGRIDEEEQASLREQMSRQERKQFDRMLEEVEKKKLHTADSFVTKRQLVGYLEMFNDMHVLKLAAQVDALIKYAERQDARIAFLELPLWRRMQYRVWTATRRLTGKAGTQEEEHGEDATDAGTGALGSEARADEDGAGQVQADAAGDGLHDGSGGHEGHAAPEAGRGSERGGPVLAGAGGKGFRSSEA